jgi:hypothetical protein
LPPPADEEQRWTIAAFHNARYYAEKRLLPSQRLGAIWLFSSGTANSVYRFIRYQQNRKPTSSAVPDKSLLLPLSENSIIQTDRLALSYLRKQVSSGVAGDWIAAPRSGRGQVSRE